MVNFPPAQTTGLGDFFWKVIDLKKKLVKFLSYVLVAALASAATFFVTSEDLSPNVAKLAQLEQLLSEKFIGEADLTEMGDTAAAGMVQALGDRWSYYIPADEYEAYLEQMANSYVGVGITITLLEDGSGIEVIQVAEGGPAQEAGIQVGDIIIGVAGQSIAGMDTTQVRDLVKGEEGTWVDLTLHRGSVEMTLSVERRTVETPVATGVLLEDSVGLITIVNFDSRCAEETIAVIEALLEQGADALIFDVRYNPGGYAHELVKVLDYILPEGDLFRTVDYAGNEDVDKSDDACMTGIPMAVLVNSESYSAAEFFAAALREYDYAIVVGEHTVGKGYFQRTYQLEDGSAVGVSVGKYFTPNGVSLSEEGGLTPDIEIPVTEEEAYGIYSGTLDPMADPQVIAAMDALQ